MLPHGKDTMDFGDRDIITRNTTPSQMKINSNSVILSNRDPEESYLNG